MRIHTLERGQWLPVPVEKAFAFFADAGNLDRITPPWLHFHILTPLPMELKQGALLDYTLRWRWMPIRWRTEITLWEPPYRFEDRQLRGPYRQWVHTHHFEPRDGGTWMTDRVDYAVPGRLLEPLVHRLLVGPDVERIFDYRREVIEKILTGKPHP